MSGVSTVQPMNYAEANACVKAIHLGLRGLRNQVVSLYQREGWRALGYESWQQCVNAEFTQSYNYINKVLNAGITEQSLLPSTTESTTVHNVVQHNIPERQLRELGRIPDIEERREVWKEVNEAHGENVTAAKIRAVAEAKEVDDKRWALLDELVPPDDEDRRLSTQISWHETTDAVRKLFDLKLEHFVPFITDTQRGYARSLIARGRVWLDELEARLNEAENQTIRRVK